MSFIQLPALDSLSPDDLDKLYAQVAAFEADLRARIITRHPPAQPDRVLTLDEAALLLGMSKAWLSRRANWSRVNGAYRDQDRRIKFPLAALETYIRQQQGP